MVASDFLKTRRLLLLSGAIGLGFGLSSLVPHTVNAQTTLELTPSQGWAVSKVQGETPYCTLSRPYSNESVLSFGRNMDDAYSLAIDFQKPALDPTRAYSITVQPGPGQLRAYQMTPISPQAFVVSLGDDVDFLNALDDTKALKIKIEEDSYTYKVQDFAAGLSDLRACKTAQDIAKKTTDPDENERSEKSAATEAEQSAPSLEANLLNADAATSGKNFAAKKTTAAAAIPAPKVEVETVVTQGTDKSEMRVTKVDVDTKETERQINAEDILKMSAVDKRADIKLESDNKDKTLTPEPVTVAADQPKSEEKKKTVEEAIKTPQKKPQEKIQETAKKAEPTPAVPVPVSTRLSSADYKKIGQAELLEKEIQALRKRNQQLVSDVARVDAERNFENKQEISSARSQIVELQSRLDATNEDNQKLLQDMEKLRLVNEDQAMSSASGNWDLEKATKRFNESEREIQRLAGQIEIERTSCQAKMAKTEQMLFDPALSDTAQRSQIAGMEAEMAAMRDQQSKRAQEMKAQVAKAVAAKTAELDALEKQLLNENKQKQEKELKLTSLNTDMEGLNAKLERLSAQLEAEKAKPDFDPALAIEKDVLEKQMANARVEKAQLKADLAAAKSEIASQAIAASSLAETEKRLQETQSEKQALQNQLATLRTDLNSKKTELQQKIGVSNNLKAAMDEKTQLQVQLTALRADLNAKNAELQQKVGVSNDLQLAMDEKRRLQEELASMRTDLNKSRMDIAKTASSGAVQTEQMASLRTQNERMRNQLSLKDKELVTIRNQAAKNQQELMVVQSEKAALQSGNSAEANELAMLKREMQNLRSQMDRMKSANEKQVSALKMDNQRIQAQAQRAAKAQAQQRPVPVRAAAAIAPQEITPSTGRARPASQVRQPDVKIKPAPPAIPPSILSRSKLVSMLSAAGLSARAVQEAGEGGYQWQAGQLNGRASVQKMAGISVDGAIQRYIASSKAQCQGDFASMPSSAATRRTSYEIACISPVSSKSSSVLFYQDSGSLVAIAHEIDATDMDIAMDARDRLMGQVSNVRAAAY